MRCAGAELCPFFFPFRGASSSSLRLTSCDEVTIKYLLIATAVSSASQRPHLRNSVVKAATAGFPAAELPRYSWMYSAVSPLEARPIKNSTRVRSSLPFSSFICPLHQSLPRKSRF